MRIVAGKARGRRLQTLDGEDTRPTLASVKEAMFSAVQRYLPGASVLDLYAGSGQLGLEALSRGASFCCFVENNPKAAALVAQNVEACGFGGQSKIVRRDAGAFLGGAIEAGFNLVLLDPPFASGTLPGILQQVALCCAPAAQVLCETQLGVDFPDEVAGLVLKKQYRHGTVLLSRYEMAEEKLDS